MKELDLMERILIPDFTDLPEEELLRCVQTVQEKRTHLWSEAHKNRGANKPKRTKPKKNGTKSLKSEDDLAKLLSSMSPAQLKAFKAKLNLP